MTKENIHDELDRLRNELENVAISDTEAKDRINGLINDLEKRFDESADNSEDDESLIENIQDAISQFETEHPRATAILNDIMVTLSNMGI